MPHHVEYTGCGLGPPNTTGAALVEAREAARTGADHDRCGQTSDGGLQHRLRLPPNVGVQRCPALHAVYYPAAENDPAKPLILTCGGFDSTLEEQYFLFAKAALERGYSCLAFEGPGQSSVIPEQGLPFTHEWEHPTKAVLDRFATLYPQPAKIVMIGSSLGGYLAPRAAAFENRIDGVVAFGALFDFGAVGRLKLPAAARFLMDRGYHGTTRRLMKLRMRMDTTARWGINHARWALGVDDPVDVFVAAMPRFSLAEVAENIRCPVLIVTGERDHLVPPEQIEQMKQSLVNAKSVTTRVFTEEEGGAEHCQMGAFNLFYEELFDWLERHVPSQP